MIGNLPDGWRVEKLKDITEFLTCGVAKRPEYVDKEVGIPFLSSKNAKTNRMILNDYNCVSKEDYEVLTKYYKPQRGDILYTRVGSFGEAVVVNVDFDFAVFVSLTIMRVTSNIVNNHYISNILNSPSIKQLANEKAKGAGVKNLNVSDVRNFDIPIPPLPQQENIVKVLDISSALIEKQKELIQKYDLFLKSKFIEMFGDPIKNTMGWDTKKIQEVCFSGSGGTPSRKKPEYYKGNIPWIKSGELNLGTITETSEHISEEALKNSSAKLVKPNSVLVAMYGATVGVSAITKIEATTNQAVCFLNPKTNDLSEEFLLAFFRFIKKELIKKSVGGGQPNISQDIIKNTVIIMPPIELQNKFASIVEKTEKIKKQEAQKLEHLQMLHNSLMDKAFKGEIK